MIRDDIAAERLALLREHEDALPRSQQESIGWSSVASDCRRETWSRLHGVPQVNRPNMRTLASLRGHAVHAYVEPAFVAAGWETELPVEYAGIPGNVDLYRDGVVEDTKTGDGDKVRSLRLYGPSRAWRVQVQGYARAIADSGRPVHTVRITAYAVDSSEEVVTWEEPYDPQVAEDAVADLAVLAEQDEPPRFGKDPSYCQHWCPFYDPDGTQGGCPSWGIRDLPELDDERQRQAVLDLAELADLAKRKAAAKTVLDGVTGTVDGWTVRQASRRGSTTVDVAALDREGYELLVGPWPERQGAPSSWVEVKQTRKAKP